MHQNKTLKGESVLKLDSENKGTQWCFWPDADKMGQRYLFIKVSFLYPNHSLAAFADNISVIFIKSYFMHMKYRGLKPDKTLRVTSIQFQLITIQTNW